MSSYWADAASHLAAFDELTMLALPAAGQEQIATQASSVAAECYKFRAKMLHYFSLLHGVSIHYLLSGDARGCKLEILGGVGMQEAADLGRAPDHPFLVSHWINQAVSRRHILEGGLPIGSPVLSRTWQLMYLGMLSYNQACKIEDTPFPFPYMQLMCIFDIAVLLLAPVVIAVWVPHIPFATCLTFLVSLSFHSLFEAAHAMDAPFGQRANDLPLLELHGDFINRLKLLVDAATADSLRGLVLESADIVDSFADLRFAIWPEGIAQTPVITKLPATEIGVPTYQRTSDIGGTGRLRSRSRQCSAIDRPAAESDGTKLAPPFAARHPERAEAVVPVDGLVGTILSSDAGLPITAIRRIESQEARRKSRAPPQAESISRHASQATSNGRQRSRGSQEWIESP